MIKLLLSTKNLSVFSIEHGSDYVRFPEPDSSHREVDQKIPVHAVCVGREKK